MGSGSLTTVWTEVSLPVLVAVMTYLMVSPSRTVIPLRSPAVLVEVLKSQAYVEIEVTSPPR